MSRTNASPLPGPLRRVLDGYRRRWRAVNFQRGLFLTLALGAAAVGLAVAADRLFHLAPTVRVAALAVIVLLLVAGLVRWVVWPAVRRITDRDAAVRVGRHFPKMQEDLVSAVELSADARLDRDEMSRGLVASVLQRIAGRAAGQVDHRRTVSLRPLLLAAAGFLAVTGLLAAAYAVRPESVENALRRLLEPNQAIPFFSYTRLEVSPGNQVIRVGDTAKVVVALSGQVPPTVRLEGRSGNGPVYVTLPSAEGRAEWKSGALFEDFRYRVLAGDAVSDAYSIRVVPPPSLRGKSAVLKDPAYAGGDEHAVAAVQGTLDVVDGMTVVLVGELQPRGPDAEFLCEGVLACGTDRYAMKPDAEGLLRSAPFIPKKSGEFLADLTDGFGLHSRAPDSTFIRVKPDGVPQVVVTDPARDLLLLPGESVEVAVEAQDEFGLRSLVLCQRRVRGVARKDNSEAVAEEGPWIRKTLKGGGVRVRTLAAKSPLDIAGLGLVSGDGLEYKAEAADYAGEADQRLGVSTVWRITLLSEAEHLKIIQGRLGELRAELLRRATEQRAEAARVASLLPKAAKDSVAGEAQDAKARENSLESATDAVARKFKALVPEVARNASLPAETLAELDRLAQEIASVAAAPMASASQSLGKAGQGQAGKQSPSIQKAEQSETEAADRLEALAKASERLERANLLGKLAGDAERLAARQRDLKKSAETAAPKTIGRTREDLNKEEAATLDRLAEAESSLRQGIETLAKDIEQAAGSLALAAPSDAEVAQQAGEQLHDDETVDKAETLSSQMQQNRLFSSLPTHDQIAHSLSEVAKKLKQGGSPSDSMEAVTREIDEFIRRQKEINAQTQSLIAKPDSAATAEKHGDRQANLGRDVSEQGLALQELAQEIEGFESETAGALTRAGTEMKAGATDLYASAMPEGLEHGKKALALLEAARKDAQQESGSMGGAAQARRNLGAMIQLLKALGGQNKINRDTSDAAEERITDAEVFGRRMNDLAARQSGVRQDLRKLEEMIADDLASEPVGVAGRKMDTSRLALDAGDPGPETRKVQAQIVGLLEQFLSNKKGGKGRAGMNRAMALMQMLGRQPGSPPGGFQGGENAPIPPAAVGKVGEEDWRKTRGRFDDRLGEGGQETYPVQFRGLLNSYFDRLRKEPAR
jgi:hypothetical protein